MREITRGMRGDGHRGRHRLRRGHLPQTDPRESVGFIPAVCASVGRDAGEEAPRLAGPSGAEGLTAKEAGQQTGL